MSNIDVAVKSVATGGGSVEGHTHEPEKGNIEDITVNVSEETVYSKILPHTPEAGDPYYIGDIYDDNLPSIAQEWETNTASSPYLAYIKSVSTAWPHLRYLADFMEISTTPVKWKFLRANEAERQERIQRTNVVILDFPSSGSPTRRNFTSANELENTLHNAPKTDLAKTTTRLIVVEDLSRRVIEILGSKFDIDPTFFRGHIDDYSWYNIRDRWMDPPNLRASAGQQNWTRLRFVRPRYFRTSQSFKKAQEESTHFNVFRRPDEDQNQWTFMDGESIVGLTRTRASIWIDNTGDENFGAIGVILVDPTVQEGFPLWHGYRNWASVPRMRGLTQPPAGPPRISLFEDLIYWSLKYPWFPPYNKQNASSESTPIFLQPILYMACAEWLIMCEYIKTRLGQIEWELGFPSQFRPDPEVIDVSLKRLHPWRRLIPLYRDMLTEAMGEVIPFASRARNTTSSSDMDNRALSCGSSQTGFGDTNADLEIILRQIIELQSRTDRLTSVVMATITMEDARRGLRESGNVRRLTWLAFVFIPLSFLTGLFSMQSDITTLRLTFAWYFAAAVPVTALTLTIALIMSHFRGKEGNVKSTKK